MKLITIATTGVLPAGVAEVVLFSVVMVLAVVAEVVLFSVVVVVLSGVVLLSVPAVHEVLL